MAVTLDRAGLFVYLFCLFFYLLLRGVVQVSEGQSGGDTRGAEVGERKGEREKQGSPNLTPCGTQTLDSAG